MKTAVIVKNASQVEDALRQGGANWLFLCTNETVQRGCVQRNLPNELVAEETIAEEWAAINTWAVAKMSSFIGRLSGDARFFADADYIDVKALFVHVLKSILAAQKLIERHGIGRILASESSLLGTVLKFYLPAFRPEVRCEIRNVPGENACPSAGTSPKEFVRRIAEAWTNFVSGRRIRAAVRSGKEVLLVAGGIHHLGAALKEIASRRTLEIVWCERSFNAEKNNFCAKNGFAFLTVPPASGDRNPMAGIRRYFDAGDVVYGGTDYSEVFENVFRAVFKTDRLRLAYDPGAVRRLVCLSAGVLLDEDFAYLRIFAIAAKEAGKPSFVVSHGVPGLVMEPNAGSEAGQYEASLTFVQSEIEKGAYEGIGYRSSDLAVTGVPRYDAITAIRPDSRAVRTDGKKTLLFCGSSMVDYDFDDLYTVLGCKWFLGECHKRYLFDLLDIAEKRNDLFIVLKPHYNDMDVYGRILAARPALASKVEVVHVRSNIFELESRADAVITLESSVICESVMANRPVIVLNYSPADLTVPYERYGVVRHVRNKAEFEKGIDACLYDAACREEMQKSREASFPLFAGAFDGNNTRRVADCILARLEPSPARPAPELVRAS